MSRLRADWATPGVGESPLESSDAPVLEPGSGCDLTVGQTAKRLASQDRRTQEPRVRRYPCLSPSAARPLWAMSHVSPLRPRSRETRHLVPDHAHERGKALAAFDALHLPGAGWHARAQSKPGGRMEDLNCPRCGYAMSMRRDDDIEHCPRCLAQTAGALSIRLEPPSGNRTSRSAARTVIDQLTRRVRLQLSK